jgi:hypothetical protein
VRSSIRAIKAVTGWAESGAVAARARRAVRARRCILVGGLGAGVGNGGALVLEYWRVGCVSVG